MGLSLPKSNLIFLKKCLDKWVHFNPNAPGLVEWPAANAENQPYQYIDVVTTSFDELTPFDEMVMEYYTNLYGLGE